MSDWIPYQRDLWDKQPLPHERQWVLVTLAPRPDDGLPSGVAAGYLRFAAGCKDSPQFIIPGIGGEVEAWCDILPPDFSFGQWQECR